MPLLLPSQIAAAFQNSRWPVSTHSLDSVQAHFESQIEKLQQDVDDLLSIAPMIDDRRLLESILAELFERIAVEEDALESVIEYRREHSL